MQDTSNELAKSGEVFEVPNIFKEGGAVFSPSEQRIQNEINRLLNEMPLNQRHLLLTYMMTRDYVSTAKIMGSSPGAVKKIVNSPTAQRVISLETLLLQRKTTAASNWIIEKLKSFAEVNLFDVIEVIDGKVVIKDSAELSDAEKEAIKSIKIRKGGGVEIELHDKINILQLLGRYFQLEKKTVEHKHSGQVEMRIEISDLTDSEIEGDADFEELED